MGSHSMIPRTFRQENTIFLASVNWTVAIGITLNEKQGWPCIPWLKGFHEFACPRRLPRCLTRPRLITIFIESRRYGTHRAFSSLSRKFWRKRERKFLSERRIARLFVLYAPLARVLISSRPLLVSNSSRTNWSFSYVLKKFSFLFLFLCVCFYPLFCPIFFYRG